MTAFTELLPYGEDRTDEWFAERGPGIGGSEIAAVLGIAPSWGDSAWSLWHRKKGVLPRSQPDNDAMRWGRRMEGVILAEFTARHPELAVTRFGLCASVKRPWQLCSPDAVCYDDTGESEEWGTDTDPLSLGEPIAAVEAKTTESWDGWGEEGSADIPAYYRTQCLWQMDVLGVDVVYVPVAKGRTLREYVLWRDDDAKEDLAFMRDRAAAFLDSLTDDTPPEVDGHDATLTAMWQLHPEVEDRAEEIPEGLADAYRALRASLKEGETALQEATARILDIIGNAKRAVDPDGNSVLSRSVFPSKRVDVKRLRAERPEVAAEFEATSTTHKVNPSKVKT